MSHYEYRVVPAPRSLAKVRGAKDPEERYGRTLELALNAEGREGWEFQRIETVTMPVRRGMFARMQAEPMTVMVFRRRAESADLAEWERSEAQDAPQGQPGRRAQAAAATRHDVEPPLRPLRGQERR